MNEISKIFKNNVGNVIKTLVDKEIIENKRVKIAYITAIIGLVTAIITFIVLILKII